MLCTLSSLWRAVARTFSHFNVHHKRRKTGCALVAISLTVCIGCCGCAAGDGNGQPNPETGTAADTKSATETLQPSESQLAAAQPLVIEESGWWAKDSYVHFAVMVHNPNENLAATDTTIAITLYDQNGAVTFQDEQTIALVGPGARVGFCGTSGDGWAPTSVEMSIVEDTTSWESGEGFQEPYAIEEFAEQDKLYFRYEVTGTMTNLTGEYASTVPLSLVLRDETGAIVAGYTGEAYRIKAGQTKDFLVTMHSAPDHATVELYAQPY